MEKFKNNSLKTRIISAIIFAIIFALALINKFSFLAIFGFFMAQTLWEFYKISENNKAKPKKILGLILSILIFTSLFLFENGYIKEVPLYLFIFLIFISLILEVFRKNVNTINSVTSEVFGIIYIAIPFSLTNLLVFRSGKFDFSLLLTIFLFIWTFDIFAYFTGVMFGKTKIVPDISPKKSLEGTIGGLIFSVAVAIPIFYIFKTISLYNYIILAILVSIAAFLGDLFESKIKRTANVKDSGKIMPGHGGLLDRFDSFIFSIIFATIFLYILKEI